MSIAAPAKTLDAAALRRRLDGEHAPARDHVRDLIGRPEFARPVDIRRDEHRTKVMEWAKLLVRDGVTAPKDQFGELNPFGIAGFLAGQVYERVVERTAARAVLARLRDDLAPSREQDGDLLDRDYQLGLLTWREEHMLTSLARRFKRGTDAGEDPFNVLIECQDHAVTAARAHMERVVAESFVAGIERTKDAELVEVLDTLCSLYILSTVERDRGWFLEHGRISSTRSKATTRAVNRLCAEVREHAGELVDAFGIPDEVLGAPIGLSASNA